LQFFEDPSIDAQVDCCIKAEMFCATDGYDLSWIIATKNDFLYVLPPFELCSVHEAPLVLWLQLAARIMTFSYSWLECAASPSASSSSPSLRAGTAKRAA